MAYNSKCSRSDSTEAVCPDRCPSDYGHKHLQFFNMKSETACYGNSCTLILIF